MPTLKFLALALPLLISNSVSAKRLQILHTNDLHSYFAGTRGGLGGYARVRTVVDDLKAKAKAQGMETLYLDGGDFGEGSSFYFSNEGTDSLRALDLLGVDATVLGNHDYILGGPALKNQIIDAKLKTPILSANLVGKTLMGLDNYIPDFLDFNLDGMKIRVFGLTTPEIHFQYPLRPLGFISPSHNAGIKQAELAQRDGVDFLIALTHTGINPDIILARNTFSVNLIVGGHDHFLLKEPEMVENLNGNLIPIVQAGSHGGVVGQIIMDIKGNGEAQLVSYKQITVDSKIEKNPVVDEFVGNAFTNREQYFGRRWDEVIGTTEIVLNGNVNGNHQNQQSCWSKHMARLMRTTANSDLAMHFDTFQGEQIEPGNVTFGDIVDNFPHFRRWGDLGWSVSRTWINGWILKKVIALLNAPAASGLGMTIDGLGAYSDEVRGVVAYDPLIHKPTQARVKGKSIRNFKFYSVAFPSEIPFGLKKISRLSNYIIRNTENLEDSHFWPLMENYIRENSPLKCLAD